MTVQKNHQNLYRIVFCLMIAVLLLSVIPILALGKYDVQSADDYAYGAETHQEYRKTGDLLQVIRAGWAQVCSSYQNWQGTFSAIFLMTLQPAVFAYDLYAVTPFIMLGSLILGFFSLNFALFEDVFHCERSLGGCVAAITALTCIQMLFSPVEGIYWYNGAVYYTFFHGIALLSAAIMIRFIARGGRGRLLLLCLLEGLLGGGNYPTALFSFLVLISTMLVLALMRNPAWKRLLLPFAVLMLSFSINLSAPGNTVRTSELDSSISVPGAILASLQDGAHSCISWMNLPIFGCVLFLAALYPRAIRNTSFSFRYPGLVSLWSYCLFSAMFCPTEYTMGMTGPLRLIDIIWDTYILLLFLNVFYWEGWLLKQNKIRIRQKAEFRLIPITGALCMTLWGVFLFQGGAYTATAAIGLLRSGEARQYHEEQVGRLAVLEDPEIQNVELEPLSCTPYLIYWADLEEDAEASFINQSMADFYGKKSVRLKTDG